MKQTAYKYEGDLITIAGHTVKGSLIQDEPVIMDVGCRGFDFRDGILGLWPNASVHCFDIDLLPGGGDYTRAAITGHCGFVGCSKDSAPEARHIVPGRTVPCYTVAAYSELVGVTFWDVMKLDCEGSEWDILWSLKEPCARQITVEFHQHTNWARRTDSEMESLLAHLERWYKPVKHKMSSPPGFNGAVNYWDSLFVIK